MANWETEVLEWIGYYWNQFTDWFLSQPLFAQILFVILILAIVVIAVILTYYVIKGVAYFIYYLVLGLYYLFKAIILGLYKLFKKIYKKIQGRSNQPIPPYQNYHTPIVNSKLVDQSNLKIEKIGVKYPGETRFCSECGMEFSVKVMDLLKSKGTAFCEQCGRKQAFNPIKIEI